MLIPPRQSYSLDIASICTKVNTGHGFADEVINSVQEINRLLAQSSETNAVCLDVEQCITVSVRGGFDGDIVDRATLKVEDGGPDLAITELPPTQDRGKHLPKYLCLSRPYR